MSLAFVIGLRIIVKVAFIKVSAVASVNETAVSVIHYKT